MQEHYFSGGLVQKIDENIMLIRFEKDYEIQIEDVKQITAIRKQLFGDQPYCSLVDVSKDFLSFSKEAKDYVSSNPSINALRVCEALLVRSLGQKIGADLFIRLFRKKVNTKTFTKKESAIEWLQKEFSENQIKKAS